MRRGGAPLLSIFGGKITTYRRLAEAALEKLEAYFAAPRRRKAGRQGAAAGRRFRVTAVAALTAELTRTLSVPRPGACAAGWRGLWHARARLLGSANRWPISAVASAPTLTEAEVRYLIANEWACTAEDVLWRRTKLGLRLSPDEIAALDDMDGNAHRAAVSGRLREAGRGR